MSVLSDDEIWSLLGRGRLKIDPYPSDRAVSPSSVDLKLGNLFSEPPSEEDILETQIDPRDSSKIKAVLSSKYKDTEVPDGEYFALRPGQFLLGWTKEKIVLPNFISARIEGRSTLARLGLSVHQTAPTVHATFSNPLQLEMKNVGPYTIQLYPGMYVCQLVLERMSQPSATRLQSVHQGDED